MTFYTLKLCFIIRISLPVQRKQENTCGTSSKSGRGWQGQPPGVHISPSWWDLLCVLWVLLFTRPLSGLWTIKQHNVFEGKVTLCCMRQNLERSPLWVSTGEFSIDGGRVIPWKEEAASTQGIFISGMRLVIPQSTVVLVRMSTGQVRHSWLLSINTCIDLICPCIMDICKIWSLTLHLNLHEPTQNSDAELNPGISGTCL